MGLRNMDDKAKQITRVAILSLWTLLMASLATAAYVELRDLDMEAIDPSFPTLTWIAVLQSLVALGLSFGEKSASSAGNNAVLAMMFSGIYIGQVAPEYIQDKDLTENPKGLWSWDDSDQRQNWMKMQVAAMVFA